MKMRTRAIMTALSTVLLACASSAMAQPATAITVEVLDGPKQGTYLAESADVTCSYGYAGEGLWGNQYSISDATPEEFSSLQLIVDASDAAEEGGTERFLATFSFGALFTPEETSYTISSGGDNPRGHGVVHLEDRGSTATVHISGVSEEGVALEATIQCHRVVRLADSAEPEPETGGPVSLTVADRAFEFVATSEEAYCSEALAEDYDFQYGYQPVEYDGDVYAVEVYLPDLRRPGEFYVSVVLSDGDFSVDTMDGNRDGEGTVTIKEDGSRRVIEFVGTASSGDQLRLRAECGVE